jgi:hypothetical protein
MIVDTQKQWRIAGRTLKQVLEALQEPIQLRPHHVQTTQHAPLEDRRRPLKQRIDQAAQRHRLISPA